MATSSILNECCRLQHPQPVESSLSGFFGNLFNTSSYPPRWSCGSWTSLEGWLHIGSDAAIFGAYFAIPCALLYFTVKRRDIPFNAIFVLFAAFILFCGTGHLLEAIIFYAPIYRVAGLLKLATAIVSWATFFVLLRLVPKALALPGLAAVNAELERASACKSQFLANMSHEIRTPLTAILGFGDMLQDPALTPQERQDAVATIRRNGHHLLEVINDILDLTKVEAGKLEVEPCSVSPSALLEHVRTVFASQAEAKGIAFTATSIGPMPQTITTDPTRLTQAMLNLAGNAVKFTHHGSVRVTMSCDRSAERLTFEVRDSGIGLQADQLERIFEPFQQADVSTTRKYRGTGLGLTITRHIAHLLGGDVRVDSQAGVGSTFTLSVATGPLAGVAMHQPEGRPISESRNGSRLGPQLAGRILVVDDGPENLRLVSFVLRKAGASVDQAENGQIGVDAALRAVAEGRPFDVIVMDMQMPVLDGYAATRKLREAGYTGQIVALTANAMAGAEEQCLNAGCDAYLTKPIDRAQFLADIEARMGLQPACAAMA